MGEIKGAGTSNCVLYTGVTLMACSVLWLVVWACLMKLPAGRYGPSLLFFFAKILSFFCYKYDADEGQCGMVCLTSLPVYTMLFLGLGLVLAKQHEAADREEEAQVEV